MIRDHSRWSKVGGKSFLEKCSQEVLRPLSSSRRRSSRFARLSVSLPHYPNAWNSFNNWFGAANLANSDQPKDMQLIELSNVSF